MNGPFRLRPSSAHIWAYCSGYLRMSALYPEIPGLSDDTVREEGNACHWLTHQMGKGFIVPEGAIAPNGVEITDEMIEAADMFLAELRSWGCDVYQEVLLQAPWIHPTECGGTPDAFAYNAASHTVYVGDLKFGYNPVDPFENFQEVIYVSAVVEKLKLCDENLRVVLVICQPRAFGLQPIRRWETTLGALRSLLNDLFLAAQNALGENPLCTPGPYCEDCSGRHACPALQSSALRAMDISSRSVPQELTAWAAGDALRRIKRARELLEALETGLESQIEHYLANGQAVPFFQMGHGRGKTIWKEGKEQEAIALAKMLGHDIRKPQRAITPKQAENVFSADILARFSETRKGRSKLVPVTETSIKKRLQ